MKRILIIEDDDSHLRMLYTVLTKSGYEVAKAADGIRGCEMFKQSSCDLVITDIFMPEQEGLETITELCAQHPEIKIIAISGGGAGSNYGAKDILEIAKELGATQVMSKPIHIPDLLKSIENLIGE